MKELKRKQQYAVGVTLDPDTANPYLILSDDGKQESNATLLFVGTAVSDLIQRHHLLHHYRSPKKVSFSDP
ncbi:hypothetical protein QQF64_030853 [Cirrhinus molitorella]|uniref:Uncharacterized protein n=2 Tax=Cirrhinus molitorella TaxID=172907 RepID=A0ABR3N4T2_9TELE|nr:hypothetical protein Q8A67_001815 [Cirrhinus molitorella]